MGESPHEGVERQNDIFQFLPGGLYAFLERFLKRHGLPGTPYMKESTVAVNVLPEAIDRKNEMGTWIRR
jgi:hypothetical protein